MRFTFDWLLCTVLNKPKAAVYTGELHEHTIVVYLLSLYHTADFGYVRKLNSMGVCMWMLESTATKVSFACFRQRCAADEMIGVFFEGGAQLAVGALA